jgi:hypothetical protein
MADTQNFKNHGRIVPVYHVYVFLILVVYFVWSAYRLTQGLTVDAVMGLLLIVGLIMLFFSVRVQILTVQDRVIRLEMRLRMRQLLRAELAARAGELPVKQLVALRFASDAELPTLIEEVVEGRLTLPKDIKQRVKDWQSDFLRA